MPTHIEFIEKKRAKNEWRRWWRRHIHAHTFDLSVVGFLPFWKLIKNERRDKRRSEIFLLKLSEWYRRALLSHTHSIHSFRSYDQDQHTIVSLGDPEAQRQWCASGSCRMIKMHFQFVWTFSPLPYETVQMIREMQLTSSYLCTSIAVTLNLIFYARLTAHRVWHLHVGPFH